MKCNTKKICMAIILSIILIFASNITLAHSGRTDSSGGHKDNKNASELGSYHYHCGGHPPHLHTNGVCPYSSSSSTSKSSSSKSSTSSSSSSQSSSSKSSTSSSSSSQSSSSKSSTKVSSSSAVTTSAEPVIVIATSIEISKSFTEIKEGDSKKLTATISPSDTTDKNISWKSSDENIAVITSTGEVIARKAGTAKITATTSNGKENTIEITIEDVKEENNIIQNSIKSDSKDSNLVGGIIGLGLLGGGGYWGYKKYRKSKQ